MILRISLALPFFLFALHTHAQNWTGTVDNNWNNPANWDQWPLDGEDVTIDPANYSGAMADPVLSTASIFSPDRLYVEGSAVLTIDAALSVADRFIVTGPAQVEMTGGTLSSDRLVMDLGGLFDMQGGNVNVTSVLALADGGTIDDSRFEQGAGSVTITGELGFECETGDFEPAYEMGGGTLYVNGDVVWFGAAPGSGRPSLKLNGGTTTVTGDIVNTNNSTVDLYILLETTATLTLLGANIDLPHTTDSLVMTGGALHIAGNAGLSNDGVLHASGGDIYFDTQCELLGIGSYRFHNVNISSGAVLQHTQPAEITVAGSWINLGSFDPDGNTIAFAGAALQTVSSTAFHGVRVNNAGTGVSLVGPSSVAGDLLLDNGLIHSQSNDLLTLLHGSTSTSGSVASHVNGPMRKIGNDDFVFPVGKNGQWRRIGVQDINDQDTEFTAEFFDVPFGNTTSLAPGLIAVSDIEHWSLVRAGSSDDARVALHWEDAAASGLSACAGVAVAHWDGSQWNGTLSTVAGSCTGNDPGNTTSNTAINTFDVFTIGAASNDVGLAVSGDRSVVTVSHDQSSGELVIQGLRHPAVVELFDLQGRKITAFEVGQGTSRLKLPRVADGIHAVTVHGAGGREVHRVFLQSR